MANEFYDELISYKNDEESKRQFARKLGVHPSMLTYWQKGMQPKEDTLKKIAKVLLPKNIQAHWVEWALKGGGMPAPRGEVIPINKYAADLERERRSDDIFVAVPAALPFIRDGQVCFSSDGAWFMFRRDWLETHCTRSENVWLKVIWGRCMAPELRPSDVVLVDSGRVGLIDGGIYAVNIDNSILMRRITLLRGGLVRLSSDENPADIIEGYPEELQILGAAIWVGRTL